MADVHKEAQMNSDKKENVEDQVADLDRSPVVARWARIESEIDGIQDYIDREKRSVQIRISKWAGVAALLISIVVGGLTVHNSIFVDPKQRQAQDLAQLRDIITQIGRANLDIASRVSTMKFDFADVNYSQISNGIKLPLTLNAVEIIEKYPEHVPIFAFMAIMPELSYAQYHARAISLGEIARKRIQEEKINIAVFSELTRLMANAYMGRGSDEDKEKARRLYLESIDEAENLEGTIKHWITANTIRDWSGSEAIYGNCDDSIKIFERLITNIDEPIGHPARCFTAKFIIHSIQQLNICKIEEYTDIFINMKCNA